jgi:sodium/hydrogen antiporter
MSRTLSLRGNHEPEWAGQTVKVTRPEDIVINRDVLPQPGATLERDMEEGRAGATTFNSSDTTGRANDEESASPGSDDVTIREWREGRHLVREYHPKRPGEEVSPRIYATSFASDLKFPGPCGGHSRRI